MKNTHGVTFKKDANLEFFNSLANCLLIIDDPCKKIYNNKELIKLPTAGRHKIINVFY